jgi:putative membrane protein
MKRSIVVFAAALAGIFAFCQVGQAKDQAAAGAQQQVGQQPAQAGTATGQDAIKAADQIRARAEEMNDPQADQKFIKAASSGNEFEIQSAQFVEQNAKNQQVKELAQKIGQDHQQAQQRLQQVAQQMNVQLDSTLNPEEQACLQALQQKKGMALELAYTFDTVGIHHTTILWYQWEAEHSKNDQLKQYAQQEIPTLEHHLSRADEVAEMWVPQARTAGEHIRGERMQHRSGVDVPGTSGTNGGNNAAGGTNGSGTPGTGTGVTGSSGGTPSTPGSTNTGVNR